MISMSDDEMKALEADVTKIRAMADALLALGFDSDEPKVIGSLSTLRCDEAKPYDDAISLVRSAPTHDGEYITVPTAKEEVE